MRSAPFELPYHLSGVYCMGAINMIDADGMRDEFPPKLVERIETHSGFLGNGCHITQNDINGLSEKAWNYLKQKLT